MHSLRWVQWGILFWGFYSQAVLAIDLRRVESGFYTDQYDAHFRKQSKHYFGPMIDWHWFKAQGIAESNLRPNAKSYKKAYGIMQLLPSTFDEIRQNGAGFSGAQIEEPRWNIAAGIYYDRHLFRKFAAIEDVTERLNYTFGAYNAGRSRIIRSLKGLRTEKEPWPQWSSLEGSIPWETSRYVERIYWLME